MKNYTGRAFTYSEKIEGKEVIGNPASIYILEKNENFPAKAEMSEIAIKEAMPMTAFIKQKISNSFDVRYFAPSGNEFSFCGHASLIAINVIKQYFGIDKAFLYPEQIKNLEIVATINDENLAQISIPIYKLEKVSANINYLSKLKLSSKDVIECFYCKELKDYIIKVKDNKILRNAKQNTSQLSKHLKADGIRGLFITSSSNNNINYEVRIFAPHMGINEDISCGSANCSLLNIWQNKDLKQYKVLCPYKLKDKIGGFEVINYDYGNNTAMVGGYIS